MDPERREKMAAQMEIDYLGSFAFGILLVWRTRETKDVSDEYKPETLTTISRLVA